MKRRLVCLLLALFMMLPMIAMTACGGDEEANADDMEEEERNYVTIDLWLPYYEGTTEESIQLVQDALNEICEDKYSTHLVLHFVESDEYELAIQDRFVEMQEAQERLENESKVEDTEAEGAETEAVETETDEYGVPTIVYPAVGETQMDIFLIRGYDNYISYIDNNMLTELDADMAQGDPKLLKSYIYPLFLSYAKVDEVTYAIPNNHEIGEYTFLLVNKNCVDEVNKNGYEIDPEKLTSPYSSLNLIRAVAEVCPDIIPVRENFDYYSMKFWNQEGDSSLFSLIASQITRVAVEDTQVNPTNIFRCTNFTNTYYMNKLINENNWVGDGSAANGEFAVAMMSGGANIYEEYGDSYYIQILEPPTASVEDVCEYMLGVSSYTKSTARALEIITLINTNPDFRTILQYGVEGIHWKYSDADKTTIVKLSDGYNMKLYETGNTYLTYPGYEETKDYWEYSKTQNLEARVSPYMHFTVTLAATLAEVNDGIASTQAKIAEREKTIADLENQLKNFNSSTGTAEEKEDLEKDLASAKAALNSQKTMLADYEVAKRALDSLEEDSATLLAEIEAMTAEEFMASLITLRDRAAALESVAYLLSSIDYTTYKLTTDTAVDSDKVYYTFDGATYKEVKGLTAGDEIPADTYYEQFVYGASYSLLEQYQNFWNDTYGEN